MEESNVPLKPHVRQSLTQRPKTKEIQSMWISQRPTRCKRTSEKDPVSHDWDEQLQGWGNRCEYVEVLILERG
jgi:hypothetical protein